MNKLLYFPTFYPDEDFRSVLYRYHLRSDNTSFQVTRKELFDINSNKLGLVPRNLMALIEKFPIGSNITETEILEHTWFPFIKVFLNRESLTNVVNDIKYGKECSKQYTGRAMPSGKNRVLSQDVRYCPVCLYQDYKHYGEVYVHLNHQIDFIDFCLDHKVDLIKKCPSCGKELSDTLNGYLISRPCCDNIQAKEVEVTRMNKLKIKMAAEIIALKEHSQEQNGSTLMNKLKIALYNKGFINFKGDIDRPKIIDSLLKFSIGEFEDNIILDKIQKSLTNRPNMSRFLNEQYSKEYILLYILLMCYLSGSVKNFFENKETYSIPVPFGTGPWPCKNHLCPKPSKEKYLVSCHRKKHCGGIRGDFICSVCGYHYVKDWHEGMPKEKDEVYFERNKGFLWEEKVRDLFSKGLSLHKIADELICSYDSVKKYIDSIERNHGVIDSENNSLSRITSLNEIRDKYRGEILTLKNAYPDLNRTKAVTLAHKEFSWIKKHDPDWLDQQLPMPRMDYEKLDEELSEKVKKAAEEVLEENLLKQIKRAVIIRKLTQKDRNRVLVHKDNLPQTYEVLGKYIESNEDFLIRRLPKIIKELKEREYVNITVKGILSRAKGIKNCSEELSIRIREELNSIINK